MQDTFNILTMYSESGSNIYPGLHMQILNKLTPGYWKNWDMNKMIYGNQKSNRTLIESFHRYIIR